MRTVLFYSVAIAVAFAYNQSSWAGQTQQFSNGETCTVMAKLPGQIYTDKDLKIEKRLCMDSLADAKSALAICPKTINTNPGIEIFNLVSLKKSDGNSADGVAKILADKKTFEANNCDTKIDGVKKIAKFKSSVSCSYTPSLLSYYHVSRYFGNILNVPPSVIRTISPQTVGAQADIGRRLTQTTNPTIYSTWGTFKKRALDPSSDARSKYIFSADRKSILGAAVHNPTGEMPFSEYANDAGGEQMARAAAFKKEDIYLQLSNPSTVDKILSSTQMNQQNLERLVWLQDFSDMIILDTLMTQEDRYNNIHSQDQYLQVTGNSLQELEKEQYIELVSSNPQSVFKIRRVLLKDNDCGVAAESAVGRTNINVAAKIVQGLAHMKKDTYSKLQKFARDLSSPEMEAFFIKETLMTKADFQLLKSTATTLAKGMKDKCLAQQLKLDLDINLLNTGALPSWSCNE